MTERLPNNIDAGQNEWGKLQQVEFNQEQPHYSKDYYLSAAKRNLMSMSRTARGIVDTSASAEKADSMTGVTGTEAADTVQQNYDAAISYAYENRAKNFSSPADLRSFVEGLASQVNKGIVKEGNLIRSSDSHKYPYARISNLENMMSNFYNGLFDRLRAKDYDPIETAAFAEFGIDFSGHFFADGCGKVAKAVSAFALMRGDQPLPVYRGGRDVYYAHQLKKIAGEDLPADQAAYADFLNYYKDLFTEES